MQEFEGKTAVGSHDSTIWRERQYDTRIWPNYQRKTTTQALFKGWNYDTMLNSSTQYHDGNMEQKMYGVCEYWGPICVCWYLRRLIIDQTQMSTME